MYEEIYESATQPKLGKAKNQVCRLHPQATIHHGERLQVPTLQGLRLHPADDRRCE